MKTSILPTTCFKQFLCSSRLSSTFGKSLSAVFVASSNSGRDVESFLAVIEDAPLLTKTVKINQSEGIPGSGIPERAFVKNSYKRSRTSLPSSPLLFIAFFTSHRSPLSERLEQATHSVSIQLYHPQKSIQVSPACNMLLALPKFDQTM